MGTYHTFFVATDAQLDRLFPGWVTALPSKAPRPGINPFTKQPITVQDWAPAHPPKPLGSPNLYDDVWGPAAPALVVANEYMAMLEEACAPGLRALPHFRDKNVHMYAWEQLGDLAPMLDHEQTATPPIRIGREGDDNIPKVWTLSRSATETLADLADDALQPLALRILSEYEFCDEPVTDEAAAGVAADLLTPLRTLARTAIGAGSHLCSYFALHY